jgi:two-component system response regulator NreC
MDHPFAAPEDGERVPTGARFARALGLMLVDNCTVVREGLCALIERQPDLVVVAQAATVLSAGTFDVRPNVIVTDVELPDARHGDVITGLRELFPESAVLVLTLVDDPGTVQSVFDAGAAGYLLKTAATPDLVNGIRSVASGRLYLQSSLRRELERWQRLRDAALALTPKEEQVLRLVARGYTNAEVANLRGVGRRTVETHRSRIYQKLGLRTRAELFQYAWETGFLDPDPR